MSSVIFGAIPKMLIGVDANGNKGLKVKVLTYSGKMDCNIPLSNWKSEVIFIDSNGDPAIRIVMEPVDTFTCADATDYGIYECGMFLGHLVKATDGGHALLLLTV